MTSIEESGFLSDQISQWIKKHRAENSQVFDLCENINLFSHSLMLKMKVHIGNLPELLCAAYYVRAMSNFQGTVVTAERGMINEARILLRCLLECIFPVKAIETDNNYANTLTLQDFIVQKSYLKACKRFKSDGDSSCKEGLSSEKIDSMIADLEDQIKEHKVKKEQIRKIADKGGLTELYDTEYKLLSSAIHTGVRDLEQYLRINEDGMIEEIFWGPDVKDVGFILFSASEKMLLLLSVIFSIFSIEPDEKWHAIRNMHKNLDLSLLE